jgi:membrane-associated protease RseP (regulator of RpoE activity)
MSGFSALNVSRSNLQQKRFASTLCLLYLLVLSAFLITARWFDLFLWVAAVFSLIGHELIYFMIRRRERNREPMFVSDENGLKVYAVVPKSPAVEMGIQPGDLILRVNQVPVKTMADLEEAIKKQSVCKMEILTSQLERKLVQKVIYEEELKSLGVIGAVKKSEPVTESKVESEAVALQ